MVYTGAKLAFYKRGEIVSFQASLHKDRERTADLSILVRFNSRGYYTHVETMRCPHLASEDNLRNFDTIDDLLANLGEKNLPSKVLKPLMAIRNTVERN